VTSIAPSHVCGGGGYRVGGCTRRRRRTRPAEARPPPFSGGIESGTTLPHPAIVEAEGTPGVAKVTALANPREGEARVFTLLAEATGQATPTEGPVGGEATGPYWLSLYDALTAPGDQGLVLPPLAVQARRGPPCAGPRASRSRRG
jgi:hypothetical protein